MQHAYKTDFDRMRNRCLIEPRYRSQSRDFIGSLLYFGQFFRGAKCHTHPLKAQNKMLSSLYPTDGTFDDRTIIFTKNNRAQPPTILCTAYHRISILKSCKTDTISKELSYLLLFVLLFSLFRIFYSQFLITI